MRVIAEGFATLDDARWARRPRRRYAPGVVWVQGPPFHRARRLRRAATAALLALATLAFACGGDEPTPRPAPSPTATSPSSETPTVSAEPNDTATLEVTSGPTPLSLHIPAGALPAGVATSDIAIETLDLDSVALDFPDSEVLAAYRFGPDGLELSSPLLATIELPADQAGALVSLVSGAESELLEPVEVRVRGSDGRIRLVYAIEHFSDFTVWLSRESQPARLELKPRPDRTEYAVGESFTIRVLVTPGFHEGSEIVRAGNKTTRTSYRTLRDQAWDAEVTWTSGAPDDPEFFSVLASAFLVDEDTSPQRNEPPLMPTRAHAQVSGASALVGQFAAQEFTCVRVGEFQIDVRAITRVQAEEAKSVNGGPSTVTISSSKQFPAYPRSDNGEFDRITGRCVAAATPTPQPTRTPTPQPTTPPPTAEPTSTPEPSPTSAPTATPEATATPTPASLGSSVPPGSVLVFIIDGVYFRVAGLSVVAAHEPFCSYEHVHGSVITSLLPGPNGAFITRGEHLGECGFGPPNFFIVPDPR